MNTKTNIPIIRLLILLMLGGLLFTAGCDDCRHSRIRYDRRGCVNNNRRRYENTHHHHKDYHRQDRRRENYRRPSGCHTPPPCGYPGRRPRAGWDEDDWEDYIEDIEDWVDDRYDD